MSAYPFSRVSKSVPRIQTEFRGIVTNIPAFGTLEILARLDAVESRSMHGQLPIVWDHAVGNSVVDIGGNEFIDFTSGIFVANIGHSNEYLLDGLRMALNLEALHSYAYATEIRAAYLEKLTRWSGFEKAFLLSAGTEATEAALKLMRMHGQKIGKRRPGIVCIDGNWHGRTMGAQLMSSNTSQKAWIGFADPNIYHVPFPLPWGDLGGYGPADFFYGSMKGLEAQGVNIERDVCGLMLETFQGWGAFFYPPEYVQAAEKFCRARDILLCFDEMQAGFARTGRKFGFEHYGVSPDLICVGKGMGGGLPVSGVLGRADVMDLPEVGNMSSTHSGNPLVCAAGLAVIEEIDRLDLVAEAKRKGLILFRDLANLCLNKATILTAVHGVGLIAALHFKSAEFASRVCERCYQSGLLVVHTGRESIKIGPPLTIDDLAIIEGVAVIAEAIAEIEGECA